MDRIRIVDYPVSALIECRNEKNPRWMPDSQAESLRASLSSFGVVEPLILNSSTGRIVGGHQRLDAAQANGIESLPVVVVELEPDKEMALNLCLNKVRGDWDYEKLAAMLDEIDLTDLEATGFSEAEAAAIVASGSRTEAEVTTAISTATSVKQRPDSGDDATEVAESAVEPEAEEVGGWVKVQFGMFTKKFPQEQYDKWVADLKASVGDESASPTRLGEAIANRLGLIVTAQPTEEEENSPELDFTSIGSDDDLEIFADTGESIDYE